jgi:hypothetical protein
LALHVSRTTLYRWANGEDCSQARQEVIQTAKAFISAFIESALMNGKISPPSGIFLMKNWCNYKDTISIEENSISSGNHTQQLTASQLPVLKAPTDDVVEDIAPRHSKILSGADLPKL